MPEPVTVTAFIFGLLTNCAWDSVKGGFVLGRKIIESNLRKAFPPVNEHFERAILTAHYAASRACLSAAKRDAASPDDKAIIDARVKYCADHINTLKSKAPSTIAPIATRWRDILDANLARHDAIADDARTEAVGTFLLDCALGELIDRRNWAQEPPDFVQNAYRSVYISRFQIELWAALKSNREFETAYHTILLRDGAAATATIGAALADLESNLNQRLDSIEAGIEAVPQRTADLVKVALDGASAEELKRAGLREGVILELARRINADISDFDAAVRELRAAVEIATSVQQEGQIGTNLGAFVNEVLRHVAEKSAQGDFDSATTVADTAFAQWERDEAERRAASHAIGVKLLEAGLEQCLLRRNAVAAAERIQKITRLGTGDASTLFAALRQRQDDWYVRGRDKGLILDLRVAVEIARRVAALAKSSDQRHHAQTALGNALLTLGERGDDRALRDAAAAYRAALAALPEKSSPIQMAGARRNIGIVLAVIGQRFDPNELLNAILEFRLASELLAPSLHTADWAELQINIGNTLSALAARGSPQFLEDAESTYRSALSVPEQFLGGVRRAMALDGLGNSLRSIGGLLGEPAMIQEAIAAHRRARRIFRKSNSPLFWAKCIGNIASSHAILGEITKDAKHIECAASLFHLSLRERTRERDASGWSQTNHNLGRANLALARAGKYDTLFEAEVAFRNALQVRTEQSAPEAWANSTLQLIETLELQADHTSDRALAASKYTALLEYIRHVMLCVQRHQFLGLSAKAEPLQSRLLAKAAGREP